MPPPSIRFGVRAGDLRASTWKLVASRNDVYLACRPLGGALKASFHESGSWHLGFLRSFARDNFTEGDPKRENPYVAIWPRPSEIAPGVTLGFRILHPRLGVRVPISQGVNKTVVWIPAAPDGLCTEIDIFFAAPSVLVSGWPGKRSMQTELVGTLPLSRGEQVWVVHRVVPVPSLKLPSGTPRFFNNRTADDLNGGDVRSIVFGNSDDGTRWLLETAVERRAT